MTPGCDAARRLWANVANGADSPEEVAEAAERLCGQMRIELGRWIGPQGYGALLGRALALAAAKHPALKALPGLEGEEPVTAKAVKAQGVARVAAGLVALVAALIDLLGGVIGAEMAMRLVEQTGIPSPRGVVSNEARGGRDG